MKRFITILIAVFAAVVSVKHASAQAEYKLGKVTRAELERTEYPDVAQGADAVVQDEFRDVFVLPRAESSMLLEETFRKIKVLTAEGAARQAHVTIALGGGDAAREYCDTSSVAAASYTMEDGRVVKTEIARRDISYGELPDGTRCVEFRVPNVRAGSIIEYPYKKSASSSDAYNMAACEGDDMPVLRERCRVVVSHNEGQEVFTVFRDGDEPATLKHRTIGRPMGQTSFGGMIVYRPTWYGSFSPYGYAEGYSYGWGHKSVASRKSDDASAERKGGRRAARAETAKNTR